MLQHGSALKLVSLSALALSLLTPVPALARDHDKARDASRDIAEVESRLSNPETQQALGDAMAGMMAAMLDMKAAPFLKAMDRMGTSMGDRPARRDIPDNATLGDLAGPEARAMPEEVARKAPAMMSATGAMVGMMGEMLPRLEEMGKRMSEQMGKSMERAARSARHAED